jgi:hypothetical protein
MPRLKRCRSCHRMKPVAAFWRRAASRDGRDRSCGLCKVRYFRKWCADHRDSYNARQRAYYRQHLERLRAYNREYQRRRRGLMRTGQWTGRRSAG